jgi:competence protein ComEA
MTWIMTALAGVSLLLAIAVGFNGYRNNPRPGNSPLAINPAVNAPADADPLAPRLGLDPARSIRVHVAGAVKRPGVYTLPAWCRVTDAVKKAGGPTADADTDAINMADFLRDGEQLRLPARGRPEALTSHLPTPEPPALPPTAGGRGLGRYPFAHREASAEPDRSVVLNSATREQLDTLPGVGPGTADQIIAYRQEKGPFLQPEDLLNVRGIGPARYERLRDKITAP